MSHAKRGMQAMLGQPSVGWTTPSVTYDKMRQTNATATIFDADVRNYVTDTVFKSAWSNWFTAWREWYDKTLTTGAKLTTLVWNSDEVAQQAESYRQDLARFQQTYKSMKDAKGAELPMNAPLVPVGQPKPEEDKGGVPWWAFALGIAVIGGGIYVAYRLKRGADVYQKRAALFEQKVVPSFLPENVRPAFAEATALHDPSPSNCGCARDLSMQDVPRPHLKYMLSGS